MKGKVFKYGDNVDTDVIIPARYLNISDVDELSTHCMEDIDINFVKNVKQNDVIVAGYNFGCGSSREHAPLVIKENKISCVIAKSFARIFYRNSINIGLPIIECDKVDEIENDDILDIDFEKGIIENITKNKKYNINVFPEFIKKIIQAGGLMSYAKEQNNE